MYRHKKQVLIFFLGFMSILLGLELKKNGLPKKAVLFLENATTDLDEEELNCGNIFAKFLPPNVTALI